MERFSHLIKMLPTRRSDGTGMDVGKAHSFLPPHREGWLAESLNNEKCSVRQKIGEFGASQYFIRKCIRQLIRNHPIHKRCYATKTGIEKTPYLFIVPAGRLVGRLKANRKYSFLRNDW